MLRALLNFLFGNPHFTGLLPDTRLQSEKSRDYLHEERAVEAPANPFGNQKIAVSPYPYVNQLSTSSCVPHAATLALAIERKADVNNFAMLAPMFPYRLRSNFAQEGSIPQNMFDILHTFGAPLFDTLPTPQLETQANALSLTSQMYTEAKIYRGLKYFTLNTPNDIDTIAQIAQQGHGVVVTLFATEEEYSRQMPQVLYPSLKSTQAEIRHAVCVLPYSGFVSETGEKFVAIQDSAWFGGWKLRYLSETFIKARVYGALYFDTVQTLGSGAKPKHTFTQPLTIGAKSPEVMFLQQLLISEGLLPADCATGLFGGITLAGVKAFQVKYASEILVPNGLTAPTGFFGMSSIVVANRLCRT